MISDIYSTVELQEWLPFAFDLIFILNGLTVVQHITADVYS